MGRLQRVIKAFSGKDEEPKKEAFVHHGLRGDNVWTSSFDGEKNTGELGAAINYLPNYDMLRIRSWQSYLESEITKTVINRYSTWVVGSGLKLQAAPNMDVLNDSGIDMDNKSRERFNDSVEARYKLWCNSTRSSHSGMISLANLEKLSYRSAKIGGDCLVVMRLKKGNVTVQVIDGQHVSTPLDRLTDPKIVNGVEVDKNGKHVAYFVKKKGVVMAWERVPAYNGKQKTAFMVYGDRYRIDSHRGMPLIATVLETLKKLDRYKEATVGSAEERQKIVYQIIHGINSTGDNPLLKNLASAVDADLTGELPTDANGEKMARNVAVSTQKQTFNMPQDSKLETLESRNELTFKEFYDTNFDIVCAAVGIPPNVARMLYNDSFSASRASLKDWEYSLRVERKDFSDQFNANIYRFWLWAQVMQNKVQASGFVNAMASNDYDVIDSWCDARWVGANVPHIDPLKEVKAERAKLGSLSNNIPLTNVERATENLSEGESIDNMEQFKQEMDMMEELGLVTPETDSDLNADSP